MYRPERPNLWELAVLAGFVVVVITIAVWAYVAQ